MSMVPRRPPDTSPAPAPGASAGDDVHRAVAVLRALDVALAPVIGQRGVAALCHRALHLSARRHAWLGEMSIDPAVAVDLERLTQVLSRHPADEARAAGDALIQHFHDLLSGLLGPVLTEQLIGDLCTAHPDAPPAQDKTP
jgi:hypothetical protein